MPALVDGDDAAMPDDWSLDFQTTGLTHLLAVSGSNLTLVLAFVLVVARWLGVRGRGLTVGGRSVAVVFFVLLARPEPSVLRAAAMGVVALAGLSAGGRRRGIRALCVAVIVLVLLDPWLARSVGFLLSTMATAGILLLAPPWRDRLARWMPAAAGRGGRRAAGRAARLHAGDRRDLRAGSVVAVAANVLAAPAVGPATVLGLVGGLVALCSDRSAIWSGGSPACPRGGSSTVARHGARVRRGEPRLGGRAAGAGGARRCSASACGRDAPRCCRSPARDPGGLPAPGRSWSYSRGVGSAGRRRTG